MKSIKRLAVGALAAVISGFGLVGILSSTAHGANTTTGLAATSGFAQAYVRNPPNQSHSAAKYDQARYSRSCDSGWVKGSGTNCIIYRVSSYGDWKYSWAKWEYK